MCRWQSLARPAETPLPIALEQYESQNDEESRGGGHRNFEFGGQLPNSDLGSNFKPFAGTESFRRNGYQKVLLVIILMQTCADVCEPARSASVDADGRRILFGQAHTILTPTICIRSPNCCGRRQTNSIMPPSKSTMRKSSSLPSLKSILTSALLLPTSIPAALGFALSRPGGGRAPGQADNVADQSPWTPAPCQPGECKLIMLQITDVYTLENLANFKTLIEQTREESNGSEVRSVLTGDFLSPYLLSGVDRGRGMMHALNRIPLDYLTWGNHEADIDHKTVCRHVQNFKGTWLNSNMLDHDAMDHQKEYDVIELKSPDGTQTRKVGLTAVLSDDPALYKHFRNPPGAFGGATIGDPWEALTKYQGILEGPQHNCDMTLPLQHLYVPDDHRTCRDFDFPVILSGHDHHKVDETIEGTRLLKPGMNGDFATVLEISWPNAEAIKPTIRARFVQCQDYEADPVLAEENERAYDALIPLKNTELARVPPKFRPLTSNGSRDSVCSMGQFICTLLRASLNVSRQTRDHKIDAVLLMGGNIRGNTDYPDDSFFSLEALEAEIKSDEVIATVEMPGWLLAEGVEATHSGEPIPGWMQFDAGVVEDYSSGAPKVTHVGGLPIDPDRIYRVATKISDLTNGQSPPFTKYYTEHPELLPPKGNYVNIQSELMGYFARNLWHKLWDAINREVSDLCGIDDIECNAEERLDLLDRSGDGTVTVGEIQLAIRDLLGYSIDKREKTFAEFVHSFADTNDDGTVTLNDFMVLCEEMLETDERDNWPESYGSISSATKDDVKPEPVVSPRTVRTTAFIDKKKATLSA